MHPRPQASAAAFAYIEPQSIKGTHATNRAVAYLELSNIESMPNSAAEEPASRGFIFALVCTIGASSKRGLCEGACEVAQSQRYAKILLHVFPTLC